MLLPLSEEVEVLMPSLAVPAVVGLGVCVAHCHVAEVPGGDLSVGALSDFQWPKLLGYVGTVFRAAGVGCVVYNSGAT